MDEINQGATHPVEQKQKRHYFALKIYDLDHYKIIN